MLLQGFKKLIVDREGGNDQRKNIYTSRGGSEMVMKVTALKCRFIKRLRPDWIIYEMLLFSSLSSCHRPSVKTTKTTKNKSVDFN